jgi:hypothetical protein
MDLSVGHVFKDAAKILQGLPNCKLYRHLLADFDQDTLTFPWVLCHTATVSRRPVDIPYRTPP